MWVFSYNRKYYFGCLVAIILILTSCERIFIDEDDNTDNKKIFNEVWTLLDERYPFFNLKNVNWEEVYFNYEPKINKSLPEDSLFGIIGNMIKVLKDSHTDITSSKGSLYYWPLNQDYMRAFSFDVVKHAYLMHGSSSFNAVTYGKINDIGYVYISTFKEEINFEQIRMIFSLIGECKGLIFDVRNNTGGNELYANNIVRSLLKKPLNNKIIMYKNGKAHDAFLAVTNTIDPENAVNYNGQIVVLTNRATYSAANSFTNTISLLPNVTLVGDTTGGGGSLPLYYELSNGWTIRYSSNMELRPTDSLILEKGIPPDYYIKQIKSEIQDNVLDLAINILNRND